MNSISVLMYHAVEDAGHPACSRNAGEQRYVLSLQTFWEQLAYLHRKGYRSYLLEEVADMAGWPEKGIVLTFDDGHRSNYTLVLPLLLRYGFRAEFFITTDWIGTPNHLSAEEIRGLYEAGMGIGSHGLDHRYFDELPEREIVRQLRGSRELLAEITGGRITGFSAPGGGESKRVLLMLEGVDFKGMRVAGSGWL